MVNWSPNSAFKYKRHNKAICQLVSVKGQCVKKIGHGFSVYEPVPGALFPRRGIPLAWKKWRVMIKMMLYQLVEQTNIWAELHIKSFTFVRYLLRYFWCIWADICSINSLIQIAWINQYLTWAELHKRDLPLLAFLGECTAHSSQQNQCLQKIYLQSAFFWSRLKKF